MATQRAIEIANAFTKYAETGDKSLIKNFTKEEIEATLLQYHPDKGWAHYIAMEKRIEELKEKRSNRVKLEVFALILTVIFGIPTYIQLFKPQEVKVVNSSTEDISGQTGNTKKETIFKSDLSVAITDDNLASLTLDQFYRIYNDDSLTEMQHNNFVKKQIGKRVIWEGRVDSVKYEPDYSSTITVEITSIEHSVSARVFCNFDKKDKEKILNINKGQIIQVTGILNSVSLYNSMALHLYLSDCKLLRVS